MNKSFNVFLSKLKKEKVNFSLWKDFDIVDYEEFDDYVDLLNKASFDQLKKILEIDKSVVSFLNNDEKTALWIVDNFVVFYPTIKNPFESATLKFIEKKGTFLYGFAQLRNRFISIKICENLLKEKNNNFNQIELVSGKSYKEVFDTLLKYRKVVNYFKQHPKKTIQKFSELIEKRELRNDWKEKNPQTLKDLRLLNRKEQVALAFIYPEFFRGEKCLESTACFIAKHHNKIYPEILTKTIRSDLIFIKNGGDLFFVENQTEEMCEEAVRRDPKQFAYAKKQNVNMCLQALKSRKDLFYFVKIVPNPDFKTTLQNLKKKQLILDSI